MPNTSRLAGRFFSVLISLVFAIVLPRTAVAGEAVPSPAASPFGAIASLPSAHFLPWSVVRQYTLAALAPLPRLNAFDGSGPTLCQIIEAVFGAKSGASKKAAALSFIQNAVSATGPAAADYIVDNTKFQEGLSKVIDGVVECLNASVWAEQGISSISSASQPVLSAAEGRQS
jgi:hypothetical protein